MLVVRGGCERADFTDSISVRFDHCGGIVLVLLLVVSSIDSESAVHCGCSAVHHVGHDQLVSLADSRS